LITTFEAIRAYAESRNIAVTGIRDLVSACSLLARGSLKLRDLPTNDSRALVLLWYLGLAAVYLKAERKRLTLWAAPTPLTYRVARGMLAPLILRISRWTPMRILIKYLASRGGYATVEDVEEDLGGAVLEATRILMPVLKLAYGRFSRPVRKPFNRHVIEAVLFKLGEELGLLEVEKRREARLTELGYELVEDSSIEVVKTMPRVPLVLLAIASIIHHSHRITLVSPWVDYEVASALAPLLEGKQLRVISRPPHTGEHNAALKLLAEYGDILLYPRLHTKLALGNQALVSSANLTKTSLTRNLETGVYYREAPPILRVHAEEIAASASRSPLQRKAS